MSTGSEFEDPWEAFDTALERAETALQRARYRYQRVSELSTRSAAFATRLNTLEEELESIDKVLDVGEDEATEAVELADRTTLVADLLEAVWRYEADRLEAELAVYDVWNEQVPTGSRSEGGSSRTKRAEVFEIVRELVGNDKHGQLRKGEKFTLERCRVLLREVDQELRSSVPVGEYVQYCLDVVEELDSHATENLKILVREDVPVQFKEYRLEIRDRVDDIRDTVGTDRIDEGTVHDARVTLEGAAMLAYCIAVERATYEYCRRVAELVGSMSSPDRDLDALVMDRDVEALETIIEKSILGEESHSPEERILDLLSEHDGSVGRVLDASDVGTAELFDAIEELYVDGRIANVEVSVA